MGNVSVHDLVPVQPEERKDLDLMQNLDYKTYQKVNFYLYMFWSYKTLFHPPPKPSED